MNAIANRSIIGSNNVIIDTRNAGYVYLPELGIVVNSEIEKDFSHLFPGESDETKILAGIKRELTDEFIDTQIKSNRNIVFCLTEQCNFRCRYCTYSGAYEKVRTHSQKKMSLFTAGKMLDLITRLIAGEERTLKNKFVNISFYGGEPLLELPLIRDIMDYAEGLLIRKELNEKFKFRYRMTTNGYLLKSEVIDFLVERDVLIDVSLDGSQDEHDRFRVTSEGEKTWETIMSNLKDLKQKYPAYYWDKVNFLITLHPLHDYGKVESFFIENNELFRMDKVKVNFVGMSLLKKELKNSIDMRKEPQISHLNRKEVFEELDKKMTMSRISYNTTFTQMCFPGKARVFVDVDGKLHICERVKLDLPIGDVENGFDYNKIRYVHNLWSDCIIRYRCWECPAWSFCTVCLASMTDEKGNAACTVKDNALRTLTGYIENKEDEYHKRVGQNPRNPREYIRTL